MSPEPVFLHPGMDRMGKMVLSLLMISFISLKAESQLMYNGMNYTQRNTFSQFNAMSDSTTAKKKWSLNKYGGISVGYSFFNGGGASYFSAPVGLQLNRRLNDNLYAFAGVSAAPAYVNFPRSFVNTDIKKMNTNNLYMYSRFEAGLMYINDEKTFSISGSISVDRSNYPVYPYYNRTGLPKQQPQNSPLK
ncbi:MAG TPA: hypothetical protein VK166_10830 [Chitinophagaceae bacterium]|nr:hypothetical protein [Chitinophagaceae bacterium]